MAHEAEQDNQRKTQAEFHDDLCGPYTEREHLVELWAADAAASQELTNFLRKILGLRVRRAPEQAAEAVRQRFRRLK
jgi:hypothetical protein